MASKPNKPYTKPGMSKSVSKIAAERLERLKKQKQHPTSANKKDWTGGV